MTRTDRLFHYFLDHEGQPVTTFTLERLAGRRSWRTRISEARKLARYLRRDILNHQRRVYKGGQLHYVTSTYTLVRLSKSKAA